ncbi:MAG: Lacal_2735 family protein [Bacteroidia bacterium]|nr:Lacal_2735 family protein [Bacteroidia bacterium]
MLGIFRKKSKLDTLQKEYEKLMSQWHKLSSVDRAKSDEKYAEAQKILMQIEVLQKD